MAIFYKAKTPLFFFAWFVVGFLVRRIVKFEFFMREFLDQDLFVNHNTKFFFPYMFWELPGYVDE